jgi:hypothetical protein
MNDLYAAFIASELNAENARRDSINSRAAAGLTGSVGLVTLVLAVFAVLIGKDFVLTGWAKTFLVIALMALLVAAVFAVAGGFPWRLRLTAPETLHAMLDSHSNDSEDTARDAVAFCNTTVIESLRSGTAIKVWFLLGAGICQIVAVAALAACTLAVVRR